MAVSGHMSRRMLEHYSHVRMAAKRTGKRVDGWASGRGSTRSSEGKLSYVTICVANTPSAISLCLHVLEMNGGRGRTRTCDLLRVKQAL